MGLCVKTPCDYHVIIVIVVMQWASPLRDIWVWDLQVIKSKCSKSLQFDTINSPWK